ncbi:MAG: outer membrane lipoprotein-sorting protein [Flavobacteriales bacterium]|nr:outer membrane lipoprotein-sorting protein [Flavobacteriales bacterium]
MKKLIVIISVLMATTAIEKTQAQDAKEIAYKVYNRTSPKDGESDMTMTLINKKGNKRVRSIHQFFIDLGEVERQLMFFTAPADVKNTSFMNWSYDDASKNDDQWLYLPALKKVKRISSSNKDNDFMGSDFTYEDMEKRSPERDEHKFLTTETLNGEEVWVVEATPKEEEQYSKKKAWISKEKSVPLKVEFYDEDGELLKILTIKEVKKMGEYWIVVSQEMKNIQKNHSTVISLTNVTVDIGMGEDKFSQREMERGL